MAEHLEVCVYPSLNSYPKLSIYVSLSPLKTLTAPPNVAGASNILSSFFSKQVVDPRFNYSTFVELQPVNTLDMDGEIAFEMKPYPSPSILVTHDIILEASVKICQRNRLPLPDEVDLSFCNNILPSLFSKCDFVVGGTSILGGTNHFGLKNYLHQLMNFSTKVKSTWMSTSGWSDDIPNHFNNFGNTDKTGKTTYINKGYLQRKLLFRNSENTEWLKDPITLLAPLHCDIDTAKTGLLNKLGVTIHFSRASPEFYLLCNDPNVDAMIDLVDLKLHMKIVNIEPKIFLRVTEQLRKEPALYYYRRMIIYINPIAVGSLHANIEQVFQRGGANWSQTLRRWYSPASTKCLRFESR
jgi:hypothetical protein